MPKRIDLIGMRFGNYVVIACDGSGKYGVRWLCRCDCGAENVVVGTKLNTGRSLGCKSCAATVHGEASPPSPEYLSWRNAKARCTKPTDAAWKNYGGRGITMCDRWMESFEAFIEDMGRKPSLKHSIDRINNDGNYEPGNCRWATDEDQNKNKRSNHYLLRGVERATLSEWSNRLAIPVCRLRYRINRGLSDNDVLNPERFTVATFPVPERKA